MQLKNETSQKILRQVKPALVLLVLLTLLTGLVYPLLVTGVSQVVFPDQCERHVRWFRAHRTGVY